VTPKRFPDDFARSHGWSGADLDFAAFRGSFSISAHAGLPETLRVGVFGQLGPEGASGSLLEDVLLERKRDGNATSEQGMVLTLAHWDEAGVAPEAEEGKRAMRPHRAAQSPLSKNCAGTVFAQLHGGGSRQLYAAGQALVKQPSSRDFRLLVLRAGATVVVASVDRERGPGAAVESIAVGLDGCAHGRPGWLLFAGYSGRNERRRQLG
jgi:hypothetical protein